MPSLGAPVEYLFTTTNAKEMARRSVEARKANKLLPPSIAIVSLPHDQDLRRAITRTQAQLKRIDDALDTCTEAKDWDCLTRAKERLFRAWVHLAGIPGPGQRKPAPEPARRKIYSDAGPTPAPACGSQTPNQPLTPPSVVVPQPQDKPTV